MSKSKTSTAASKRRRTPGAELARMKREPTHPGEMFLEEFIKPRGFGAQAKAARAMGMSTNRLNEICSKKRGVTAETAVLMGALTGTSPQMWLHLQADYDLWHALQDVDTSRIVPLETVVTP
jgi:addiction module HigA family antidote